MIDWFKGLGIVLKIAIGLGIVVLVIGFLAMRSCQSAQIAHTATKLATGQAGAATASGADAVGTVGNRQANDMAGDQTVTETKDAIDNAADAGAVTDAGRSGLCRIHGHSSDPQCMRRAAP